MKTTDTQIAKQLRAEIAGLRARLEEAEETLRAIREGEVDAVIVSGSKGDRVFALSESDNLHRLMVETMNEAGLAATPDGLLVFCNDRAATLFGRAKEQLLGHDLVAFAAPSDAERVRQLFRTASTAPADARIEFRAAAGASLPMHIWASRLDRPGNPLICLVATDLSRIEADRDLIAQLQRQREQLRESEQFNVAVLDTAGALVVVLDMEGRIQRFNRACETLTGYAAADVNRRVFWEFLIPPEEMAGVKQTWEMLQAGDFPNQHENHWLAKDGTRRLIMWANTAILHPNRQIAYIIATGLDITERKQAENALRHSTERLSRSQQIAHLGSWDLDLVQNRLTWSDEVYRIFGLPPQQFAATYEAFLDAVHPDDRQTVNDAYSGSLRDNRDTYEIEHRVVRQPSGEIRLVHERCQHVRDTSGRIIRSEGMVHDITDRKRAEEALRASEQQFRVLIQNLQSAVALVNERGAFTIINQAFLRMFDLDADSTIKNVNDRDWNQWQVFDEQGALLDVDEHPVRKAALTRRPVRDQLVALKAPSNAELKWILVSAEPFLDAQGQVHRLICTYHDITERKAAERAITQLNAELEQRVEARTAELAATNRELEAFCYSVSHDLRTPLRSIDGFSQALMEDFSPQLNAAGRDHLQRVRSNCQRMGRLIDDLLNLSRLTRARMRHTTVDLTALAESAVAELRKAEPSRTVDVRIDPGLAAKGDPTLLGTALSNLLENAWKFTSQRPDALIEVGRASLVTGHSSLGIESNDQSPMTVPVPPMTNDQEPMTNDPAQPVFFVRDNGVGFDMRYADKLFTPFQRLHAITEFPGSGIGLATVQRVIHRHGGHVWFESAPGKGATFYFTVGATA